MYVGGRHDAATTETIDVEFRCRACGHERWVRASARGHGTAGSPGFVNMQGARDRAVTAASRDALDVAEASLAYVKCPACGRTNAEKNATSPVVLLAGPVLMLGLVGFVYGRETGAVVGAAIGLVVGVAGIWLRRVRAQAAASTVQFFDGEPRDRPFVGKRCRICDRQIVTAQDGLRCNECGAPVHRDGCADRHAAAAHASEGKRG